MQISIVAFVVAQVWTPNESSDIYPTILWWTQNFGALETISCNENGVICNVSKNRSILLDKSSSHLIVIAFYGTHFKPWDLPVQINTHNDSILWALYHEESPKNNAILLYNETLNLFNIVSTYSRHSDFPLTLQYLPHVAELTDKKYYKRINEKNQLLNSLSPVLYIQSECDTPIDRDAFVMKLQKYIQIDSYGNCLKNKILPKTVEQLHPLDLFNPVLLDFISQYKFVLSFENAICDDYITEKLWRPLIAGSIPVYWGSPTVKDWLPNTNSAILVDDFPAAYDLARFLHKVNNDDKLYESYVQHKTISVISNERLLNTTLVEDSEFTSLPKAGVNVGQFHCFLCNELHQKAFIKEDSLHTKRISTRISDTYKCTVPANSWRTHWMAGKCQNKVLMAFRQNKTVFSERTFETTWMHYMQKNWC